MTRKRTEELAEALTAEGVAARAYHAGLDSMERAQRQDLFIKDRVQVIVATVAFGMGIHKPDVRFVVHHDLPKNVESYYQETGRAGRDGLPSECVLLYSPSDAVRLHRFIDGITDEQEQMVARRHLTKLVEFCESALCRRVQLLEYFGETYRSGERRGPRGMRGVRQLPHAARANRRHARGAEVPVLCPSYPAEEPFQRGPPPRRRRPLRCRDGEGPEVGPSDALDLRHRQGAFPVRVGPFRRELLRLGLLHQNTAQFNVLEVTPSGRDFLKDRARIEVTRPLVTARLSREKREQQKKMTGAVSYDQDVFSRLRDWRKKIAAERGVPAYVIFHDSTLQAIAHEKPANLAALARIAGLGERKLITYGEQLLAVIRPPE